MDPETAKNINEFLNSAQGTWSCLGAAVVIGTITLLKLTGRHGNRAEKEVEYGKIIKQYQDYVDYHNSQTSYTGLPGEGKVIETINFLENLKEDLTTRHRIGF